jgi:hypothetical protein
MPKRKPAGATAPEQASAEIAGRVDAFCKQHLNAEYAAFTKVSRPSRRFTSPYTRSLPLLADSGVRIMGLAYSESGIVRACLDWLAIHRIKAWRANNTGVFDPAKKVFRSFHGERGVPDILGIFSQTVTLDDGAVVTFGNFLGVECKKPGMKPRHEQMVFLQEIQQHGGIGICVHSVSELTEKMRPYGVAA